MSRGHECLSPASVSPSNIWEYRQNRPSLIIKDMRELGIKETTTAKVLMARGVYKWFACRRDIIKLKDNIRDELARNYRAVERKEVRRGTKEYHRLRGYTMALEVIRAHLRKICHSERWRFPDNDFNSIGLLSEVDNAKH